MVRKATDKVVRQSHIEGRAATPAMIDTPRRALSRRARFDHWALFPSDPARFFEWLRPAVERKGFVSKGQTFAVAERLRRRLGELDGPRRTLERLADLYIATSARDRYLRAATLLGSRAWRPIEQMAQSFLDAGDRNAAVVVFQAADQPGMHQAHLRRRCHDLTGVELAPPGR